MLTGTIRSQIDSIWNTFWSGGIANPLEVIEQITYLLFTKRLDDLHTLEEAKANRLKQPMERRVFPAGKDARGRTYEDCRWSRFKNFAPAEMFTVVSEHVFPFLRTVQASEPQEIVNRALALAAGARPLPEVEIYTDERLAEFAAGEEELAKWFRERDAR